MTRLIRRFFVSLAVVAIISYGATLLAAHTPLTEWTLYAEVTVNAPAAAVWQSLTDLDSYDAWNPFFQQASGTVAVGKTLRLEAHIGTNTMTFTPTVLEAEKNRELRWLGRVLLPGIFDGEHSFTLKTLSDNRVKVVQRERFRGILVPFFRTLLSETEDKFGDLNEALKARAEGLGAQNEQRRRSSQLPGYPF